MTNGYIHRISNLIVTICYYTNLVEGFKWIFGKLTKDKKRTYKNFAIDTFILLKWIFIGIIWSLNYQSHLLTILVSYLIWTNLFTYFYYHVWTANKKDKTERNQRRFVNLILAFAFSNISFAYLYSLPFKTSFEIISGFEGRFSFLLYSSYNSLFSDYNFITVVDMTGSIITVIQLTITFIFASIILSKSIPE